MTTREQAVSWARELADMLQEDLRFEPTDGMYGGYWTADARLTTRAMARATAAMEFLRQHAGARSEWLGRATRVYESKADNSSLEAGVHAVGEILRVWADQVESGITTLPAELGEQARTVAIGDLMKQVRLLNEDRDVHPAAPIVLAGAALETALRGAAEQLELEMPARPTLDTYTQILRQHEIISKQDVKDLVQMTGLRNAAAHGAVDELSRERAGLMEQQVNMFLSRLGDLLDRDEPGTPTTG